MCALWYKKGGQTKMIFVYVLLTVLLFYGAIDLLLRAVFAVWFSADKPTQCHAVFVSGERTDIETVILRIQMQRFFLPKGAVEWLVVDCGLDEEDRALFARFCGENGIRFCSEEEFVKLAENGLQPVDKLL